MAITITIKTNQNVDQQYLPRGTTKKDTSSSLALEANLYEYQFTCRREDGETEEDFQQRYKSALAIFVGEFSKNSISEISLDNGEPKARLLGPLYRDEQIKLLFQFKLTDNGVVKDRVNLFRKYSGELCEGERKSTTVILTLTAGTTNEIKVNWIQLLGDDGYRRFSDFYQQLFHYIANHIASGNVKSISTSQAILLGPHLLNEDFEDVRSTLVRLLPEQCELQNTYEGRGSTLTTSSSALAHVRNEVLTIVAEQPIEASEFYGLAEVDGEIVEPVAPKSVTKNMPVVEDEGQSEKLRYTYTLKLRWLAASWNEDDNKPHFYTALGRVLDKFNDASIIEIHSGYYNAFDEAFVADRSGASNQSLCSKLSDGAKVKGGALGANEYTYRHGEIQLLDVCSDKQSNEPKFFVELPDIKERSLESTDESRPSEQSESEVDSLEEVAEHELSVEDGESAKQSENVIEGPQSHDEELMASVQESRTQKLSATTELGFFQKIASHEPTKKSAYGLSTIGLGAGAGVAGFEVAVFFGAASPLLAVPGVGWAAFGVGLLVALVAAIVLYKTATTQPVPENGTPSAIAFTQ